MQLCIVASTTTSCIQVICLLPVHNASNDCCCCTGEWASTVSVFEELLRTEQEEKERAETVDLTTAAQPSKASAQAGTAATAAASRDQKANRKAVKYCFEAALVAMEYTRQPQRALEVRSSSIVFDF
jgi:hypothetical protein